MESSLQTPRPPPPRPHRHRVHRKVHPLPLIGHALAHRALNARTHIGNRTKGRSIHQRAQTQVKPLPLRNSSGPHIGVGGRDAAGRNRLRGIRPNPRRGVQGHWFFTFGHQQRTEEVSHGKGEPDGHQPLSRQVIILPSCHHHNRPNAVLP